MGRPLEGRAGRRRHPADRAPAAVLADLELLDKGIDDLEGPAQDLTDRANGALDVILLVLIVGVLAAVFEEIFYRGLCSGRS